MSTLKKKSNEKKEENSQVIKRRKIYDSIIKPEHQHLRRVHEYYGEKADFTWIINDINSFINGSKDELESEVFPLTGYPFGARATITPTPNGHSVKLSLRYKHLSQSIPEEDIRVKLNPRISFTVKDQSEGKDRKDIMSIIEFNFQNEFDFNVDRTIGYVTQSLLKSPMYVVDDKLAIAIHVETPEVAQSVYSEDGTLTWAIDNFRKRKQAEVDGLSEYHLSPYFYTGPTGYRVQVRAYLNGQDEFENNGLSVHVVFMNGLYDEDLDEFFDQKTTVTIVHPTQPTRNISKSKESKYLFGHLFEMGSEEEIESFLHDDTLYYKVEIIQRK